MRSRHALLTMGLLATACGTTSGQRIDARPGQDHAARDVGSLEAGNAAEGGPIACAGRVLVDEAVNARDLGSQPLADGRTVLCNRVFRGGALSSLSSAGCTEFEHLGILSVVDLRELSVQQNQPAAACVTARARHVAAPLPKLLPDTPENYLALLQQHAAVAQVFATLGDAGSYPTYVHCEIGRDRASFVSALVLLALGASRQTVVDEFELSAAAGVVVKTPCIEAVLDAIDALGGIETYLDSAGVSAAQLSTLRQRARTP